MEDVKFVRDVLGAVGSLASLAVESLTADDLERASRLMEDDGLDYEYAKRELLTLPGVRLKVADCVLLSSLEKLEALPLDVWTLRAIS